MQEEIRIEKLTEKDALLLSKVALKAYCDHYLHLWYDEGKWYTEKYFSTEKLADELSNNNSFFFIAYLNDVAVGFLKINIDAPLSGNEEKNALELERIYLNKSVTGKGIGRKLVELTLEIATENGKKLVWLKAMDTSLDSIAFYQKMGFEISGTYVLPHKLMKEELRGMVVMEKKTEVFLKLAY